MRACVRADMVMANIVVAIYVWSYIVMAFIAMAVYCYGSMYPPDELLRRHVCLMGADTVGVGLRNQMHLRHTNAHGQGFGPAEGQFSLDNRLVVDG